jgi:hypothetical protein
MSESKLQTYRVHLTGYQSAAITVDAEDPDAALDEALNEGIPGICAQCSGWSQRWWREEGDEWTPESVTTADGEEVWTGPTGVDEAIIRELDRIAGALEKDPSKAPQLIAERIAALRGGVA